MSYYEYRELSDYINYEKRQKKKKIGRIIILLVLFLLILGVFFGVRWAYRAIVNARDRARNETVEITGIKDITCVLDPEELFEKTKLIMPYLGSYNYSMPVPQLDEPVGEEFFADATFIGNSLMQGFEAYSGIENTTVLAGKGLSVETVFTKKVVGSGNGQTTVLEALKNTKHKKVYLMFGINELEWPNENKFKERYGELIDNIKKICPGDDIYIESILPIGAKRINKEKHFDNEQVAHFNALLQGLAAEKRVYYLAVDEAYKDENGNLFEDASTDGLHLKKSYVKMWVDYLKSHAITEDKKV